jgi:hypothetical protein
MHSHTESTFISPKADKPDSTLLPLDKRAEDKNEDENGDKIPPPLFKKSPEDKDKGFVRSSTTLAKMAAIK